MHLLNIQKFAISCSYFVKFREKYINSKVYKSSKYWIVLHNHFYPFALSFILYKICAESMKQKIRYIRLIEYSTFGKLS